MKLRVSHPAIGTFVLALAPGPPMVLGRDSAEADLELPWDPRVSRRHARVWVDAGTCWFEDLGSKNGSIVSDHPLDGPTALAPGLRVFLGDTAVELAQSDDNPWADVTETGTERELPEPLRALEASLAERRSRRAPPPAVAPAVAPAIETIPAAPRAAPPHRAYPSARFTGPARVRLEGQGLLAMWREELSQGRLVVPGGSSLSRGERVWVDLHTEAGLFELPAEVVHVGPLGQAQVGVGLALGALPPRLVAALDAGLDQTSDITVEIEAPVDVLAIPPPAPDRAESSAEAEAARFVRLVTADRLYEAIRTPADATDRTVQANLQSWSDHLRELGGLLEVEHVLDPLARALAYAEAHLGTPSQRLRYDFARGLVRAEVRRQQAKTGAGPSLAVLESAWRRAFPARSERARRLREAALRAEAQGKATEAAKLRAQARDLAPFQDG